MILVSLQVYIVRQLCKSVCIDAVEWQLIAYVVLYLQQVIVQDFQRQFIG